MGKRDVYSAVTEQVIQALEGGTVPWHRPWDAESGLPRSLATRRHYRGVNVFLLGLRAAASGFGSPWWGTYGQVQALGGQVKRGEKAALVVLWRELPPKGDEEGDDGKDTGARRRLVLRHFNVFNAEQADGLPKHLTEPPEGHAFDPIQRCEQIAAGYRGGPTVGHGGADAFYSPARDHIQMPERGAFDCAAEYYSTLFHEMTHSTGHGRRLARPGLLEHHRFGDAAYCKEELVAEMGAAMLCGVAGIDQATVPNSAAYVRSWLSVLRGDTKLVVNAAAQAQRGADHILGAEFDDEGGDSAAAP